jgi:23S rRNA (pseudouridine1915-N3)-methyltransferase
LDETGRQLNNQQLATKLEEAMQQKNNSLVIIIGGPYGVSENIKKRADFVWSLSKLVLPHQLVRLFLIEQLYRSAEISKNSGYHHA